jgi:hypothetical protein
VGFEYDDGGHRDWSAVMNIRELGMSKEEFSKRFRAELDEAARQTEERLGGRVQRTYRVAYLGPKNRPLIEFEDAVDKLFANAPLFPAFIDIGVTELRDDATVVWVSPSGRPPTTWDNDWNVPQGRGPFKFLIAENVKDRRKRR